LLWRDSVVLAPLQRYRTCAVVGNGGVLLNDDRNGAYNISIFPWSLRRLRELRWSDGDSPL
jgi:hypothetical protein